MSQLLATITIVIIPVTAAVVGAAQLMGQLGL
jgi:hypothetical protein